MNYSEGLQIANFHEADRLMDEADKVMDQLMNTAKPLADGKRERLELQLAHLQSQALARATLAGIVLPPHTEAEARVAATLRIKGNS